MIFVFGSINIDLVQPTPHLPAPGETVLCDDYYLVAGGKGANQALAAARAGAKVAMIGNVGVDAFAELALQDMKSAGIDLTNVGQSDRPTACATVHVADDGENAIVVSSGANQTLTAKQADHLEFSTDDTLILQMEIPLAENWTILRHAHGRIGRTILNAAPAAPIPETALRCVDILVVNEGEGAAIAAQSGITTGNPEEIPLREIPALLASRYGLTCILTLGPEGAVVASKDVHFTSSAPTITPVDTTGAGDTFVGVLACALDGGMTLPDSVARASLAASLTCLTMGAQPAIPTKEMIDANLDRLPKIAASN
jgi:ribokinase